MTVTLESDLRSVVFWVHRWIIHITGAWYRRTVDVLSRAVMLNVTLLSRVGMQADDGTALV